MARAFRKTQSVTSQGKRKRIVRDRRTIHSVAEDTKVRTGGINVESANVVIVSKVDDRIAAHVGDRCHGAVTCQLKQLIVLNRNLMRCSRGQQLLVVLEYETVAESLAAARTVNKNQIVGAAIGLSICKGCKRRSKSTVTDGRIR